MNNLKEWAEAYVRALEDKVRASMAAIHDDSGEQAAASMDAMRAALDTPATDTGWLDAMPTPQQVAEHARTHGMDAPWQVRWRLGERWTNRIMETYEENGEWAFIGSPIPVSWGVPGVDSIKVQWRPMTAEGEPVRP
jgi:hypothetical protein